MRYPHMQTFPEYFEDVVDIISTLGYKYLYVSDNVYTFLDGEEKNGDVTYLTIDMTRKEVNKTRHVYWGKWIHNNEELPAEHEEVIKKLFKKY